MNFSTNLYYENLLETEKQKINYEEKTWFETMKRLIISKYDHLDSTQEEEIPKPNFKPKI